MQIDPSYSDGFLTGIQVLIEKHMIGKELTEIIGNIRLEGIKTPNYIFKNVSETNKSYVSVEASFYADSPKYAELVSSLARIVGAAPEEHMEDIPGTQGQEGYRVTSIRKIVDDGFFQIQLRVEENYRRK
jgi:hypothetical protein